jgi:ATP-dependent helicase/nuclease subunit B
MKNYYFIYQQLRPEDWVITGKKYLADYFRKNYANYQLQKGKSVFESQLVLPISAWIQQLWQNCLIQGYITPAYLLTTAQTHWLWDRILSASIPAMGNLETVLPLAKQAWTLCQQWEIASSLKEFKIGEVPRHWQQWAIAFEQYCQKKSYIDKDRIIPSLIQQKAFKALILPKRIFLLGFDELNPQYQSLFCYLQTQNCQIHWLRDTLDRFQNQHFVRGREEGIARSATSHATTKLGNRRSFESSLLCPDSYYAQKPSVFQADKVIDLSQVTPVDPTIRLIGLADTQTEFHKMAQWAYTTWQASGQKIGCVIPKLASCRKSALQAFQTVWQRLNPSTLSQPPIACTEPSPLSQYPLIGIALEILLLESKIEVQHFSRILRAPWIGEAYQEKSLRMQLDRDLRQQGDIQLSLERLKYYADKSGCLSLLNRLTHWQKTLIAQPIAIYPSEWVRIFAKQLQQWGWPGEIDLSKEEQQGQARWFTLLDELATGDDFLGKIHRKTALKQLLQLTHNNHFQPDIPLSTPITLLDTVATTGVHFDQLWVMGLDAVSWPPAAKVNPFIPYSLQRKKHLPHSSPEQTRQFASLTTQRLLHSAETVILSYPQLQGEQPLTPSPLLQSINQAIRPCTVADLGLAENKFWETLHNQIANWEYLEDHQAPRLNSSKPQQGGTGLLKAQAQCPFKAFAEYRLGLAAQATLNLPKPGLSARERGELLHRLLEKLWQQLSSQAILQTYSATQLAYLLDEILSIELLNIQKKRPHLWQAVFIQLEKQRCHKQLKRWLEKEKARPPFQIMQVEDKQTLKLGDLLLRLRIDRIDRLADGSLLLVDYKTSETLSCHDWLGERPNAPQLPLYSLVYAEKVQALAFAQLSAKQGGKWIGLSQNDTQIPGILPLAKFRSDLSSSHWSTLLSTWHTHLSQLVQQFQTGYALVDPKEGEKTCRYCTRSVFCRIKAKTNR